MGLLHGERARRRPTRRSGSGSSALTATNPTRPSEQPRLGSQDTDYGNAVGALEVGLELLAGESDDVIFSLGVIPKGRFDADRRPGGRPVSATRRPTWTRPWPSVRQALGHVLRPDPGRNARPRADVFLNYWIPYQAKVAFDVGRVASFYYWGIGRGFGYRDTAQDTIAVVVADPAKARERIGLLARQMRRDGQVYHHFYGDGQGEFTKHCDDPLWFILAVDEYSRKRALSASWTRRKPSSTAAPGTILDHLLAVVRFARTNVGRHGLPVFGRGDWNDTLDYIGGRTAARASGAGCSTPPCSTGCDGLLRASGRVDGADEVRAVRDRLPAGGRGHCLGRRVVHPGLRRKRPPDRLARERLRQDLHQHPELGRDRRAARPRAWSGPWTAAKRLLDGPFGPKICAPAFREIDPKIGLITRCVRGKKENGAVFYHPTAWLIQAECLLGRGARAWD